MERFADKNREIVAMLGWLTPLYLVCVICMSVCLMKSNCYSLIYSSLGELDDPFLLGHDLLSPPQL